MNSALRFRAQAPLIDQLLREIGVQGGDVGQAAKALLEGGDERMIKVYTSSVIDAPADAVWAQVRDFNGLPQWTPFVAESRIEEGQPADRIGCVRNFRLRDGGVIRERLLTLSDYDYQCSYSILESPMGVENYVATLKLTPVTDGNRTFAEWWAEFDCAPEREQRAGRADRPGRVPGGLRLAEEGRSRRYSCDDPGPPVRRDRRADRARVGGAARLQQPLGLASRGRPLRASSAASRPTRSAACASFTLKDGNHIREQLLALSDRDHVSTYCILDATLPMRNYVATVQLKRVTDGDRTFWHWESTFDVPRGREREFEQLVGGGVYEAGFTGLAAYLRRGGRPSPRRPAVESQGVVATAFGGPEVLQLQTARRARAEERRGAPAPDGDRRELHRRLHPQGPLPHDRAARRRSAWRRPASSSRATPRASAPATASPTPARRRART